MGKSPKIDPQTQARILIEALPHMQRYDEEIVVVKYGGHAMGQEHTARDFANDIVLLEQTAINPVVVHGGGLQMTRYLAERGIESQFVDGLRVTTPAILDAVIKVVAGSVNRQLVATLNRAGARAAGISGIDGSLVEAEQMDPALGSVGRVVRADPALLDALLAGGFLLGIATDLVVSYGGG